MTAGKTPRVSIGIPVFNAEKYLSECIQCFLDQTYTNLEIIISDNGSTDRTREICAGFESRDARIRYLRQEQNQGAAWNYNQVLKLARGEFFKWNAYDDRVSPDYVELCVRELDARPRDVLCYGATILIDADGKETNRFIDAMRITAERPSARLREYLHKVGLTNPIYGLMRVERLRATGGMGHFVSSDIVKVAELAMVGTFTQLPGTHFFRRIHPGGYAGPGTWSQKAVWFDPHNAGKLVLQTWTHFFGYLAAIRRTPMGRAEKLRCLAALLGWQRYGYRSLLAELVIAVRVRIFGLPKESV